MPGSAGSAEGSELRREELEGKMKGKVKELRKHLGKAAGGKEVLIGALMMNPMRMLSSVLLAL